jgi:hypothetical protein
VYFAISLVLYISCWKVKSGMTSDPVKQYKNLDIISARNLSVSCFMIIMSSLCMKHDNLFHFKFRSTHDKAADHILLETFQEKNPKP